MTTPQDMSNVQQLPHADQLAALLLLGRAAVGLAAAASDCAGAPCFASLLPGSGDCLGAHCDLGAGGGMAPISSTQAFAISIDVGGTRACKKDETDL